MLYICLRLEPPPPQKKQNKTNAAKKRKVKFQNRLWTFWIFYSGDSASYTLCAIIITLFLTKTQSYDIQRHSLIKKNNLP